VKIVNKRPCNLLNEIGLQNVFINAKQVKTDKITQIIPWFPRFYATKTTGNSQRRYSPHAWTVTFARRQRLPTEVSGCCQLAGGLKVGRRYKCVSILSGVYYTRWRSYNTLQTMLKPTPIMLIVGRYQSLGLYKKAVLSLRWPRDARYISRPWAVAEIWPVEIIQDGGRRHLEFVRIENSAIRSAVPENPTLEQNMKWIGRPVAEIWPFEIFPRWRRPPSWIWSNRN